MSRPDPSHVKTVCCVGLGTIGAGWAAYFLSRGYDVIGTDPAAGAEDSARKVIDSAWSVLEQIGHADYADKNRFRFEPDFTAALAEADFIQESAPDREQLKIDLTSEIDAAAGPDVVISSSSSQFLPTRLAMNCENPERCIVGHPFAPSYLLPLVEVVGGEKTASSVLRWAVEFYGIVGKKPLLLKKECTWYVANRIQSAVNEEAVQLVEEGICSFQDVDNAVIYGPGARWSFMGPILSLYLGGGQGGLRNFLKDFPLSESKDVETTAIQDADRMVGDMTVEELEEWRDKNLIRWMRSIQQLTDVGEDLIN